MTNLPGDDLFLNRLYSYLEKHLSCQIVQITPLRYHVFKIETLSSTFILKGFSSNHRLKLQQQFTDQLLEEGFKYTYSFLDAKHKPPLFFENIYYGCIEYIQPSKDDFTFFQQKDREEGSILLEQFHLITAKFATEYNKKLRRYNLLDRWRKGRAKFLSNLSVVKFFIHKDIIEEILKWADSSLKNLENQTKSLHSSNVILHGDVAHHNFLRAASGELFLIDFDLISIGEERFDYLQYANRILPFLDWSIDELIKLEKFSPFLHDKEFLYALVFPTDIFREWNQLISRRQYQNPRKVRQVLDLTIGQRFERQNFVNEITDRMKKE